MIIPNQVIIYPSVIEKIDAYAIWTMSISFIILRTSCKPILCNLPTITSKFISLFHPHFKSINFSFFCNIHEYSNNDPLTSVIYSSWSISFVKIVWGRLPRVANFVKFCPRDVKWAKTLMILFTTSWSLASNSLLIDMFVCDLFIEVKNFAIGKICV